MKSFFDNFNNFFNDTVKGYTASADFIRSQVKLMTSSVSSSNTEYVTACEYNVVAFICLKCQCLVLIHIEGYL